MPCNCGNKSPQELTAERLAPAREASVAQKPRQIPERLRKYYEVPPPGDADTNKEH